jgi:NitT/TauT family transport system ATP-binding protein
VIQTALELDFPAEEAARQLETAANWGRYAEILVYDDSSGMFYLEPGAGPPMPGPRTFESPGAP